MQIDAPSRVPRSTAIPSSASGRLALSDTTWFKSSHSGGGNDCVEVPHLDGGQVGVRDSKAPYGLAVVFIGDEWDAYLSDVRRLGHP